MNKLKKAEESLLMFFESIAVDQWGWVDNVRKMNSEDLEIAKIWNKSGFVLFKRSGRNYRGRKQLTYIVKLSGEAWKLAHKLRKEIIEKLGKMKNKWKVDMRKNPQLWAMQRTQHKTIDQAIKAI